YEQYLPDYVHIPPATPRLDPTGDRALAELDSILENVGPDSISAFFCEPVSAAALPAYSPPTQFWEGLKERARRYGFLICFDEIVSGMGRVGSGRLLDGLRGSLQGSSMVGEVRGRGFLLGVDLVDPRDGRSFLPDELDAASQVEDIAFGLDLLVSSTHSTQDGYAGDEVLLAPAYTSSDAELGQMVERFATTIASLERKVLQQLGRQP